VRVVTTSSGDGPGVPPCGEASACCAGASTIAPFALVTGHVRLGTAVGIYGLLCRSMHGKMNFAQLATGRCVEPNTVTSSTVLASPASLCKTEYGDQRRVGLLMAVMPWRNYCTSKLFIYAKSIRISKQGVEKTAWLWRSVRPIPGGDYFPAEAIAAPPRPCLETHGRSAAPRPESAKTALPGDNFVARCTFSPAA